MQQIYCDALTYIEVSVDVIFLAILSILPCRVSSHRTLYQLWHEVKSLLYSCIQLTFGILRTGRQKIIYMHICGDCDIKEQPMKIKTSL